MIKNNVPEAFTCIIPVRYHSTRFKGKPLAEIQGKNMIDRVYGNAQGASLIDDVIVAAYDDEIEGYCKEQGFKYFRVSPESKNGSEAVADAAASVNSLYIFELQGDQPLVTPDVIDDFLSQARADIVENPEIDIVQPFAVADVEQTGSEDVVKVAVSKSNRMLLISRQPIQSGYRTLGLYVWRRDTLLAFPKMEVTDYEKAETCHLLRFFLNDLYVQGVLLDGTNWVEVDREHHIEEVESIMKVKGIK